jgi:orotate phosphoribosyltransferase
MQGRSTLALGVDTEDTRRLLELAYEVGALMHGEFTLTSGKKSDHYFEGKRLTLSPEGSYLVGKAILDLLSEADIEAVGGVAIGGYSMVAAVTLVSHLEGRPLPAFIVREETKEHGTRRRVEGHLKEGSRVAIIDDVITTGGSISRAIEAAEAANCKVAKVVVIVDRHEGGSETLKKRGYDFTGLIDLWPAEG